MKCLLTNFALSILQNASDMVLADDNFATIVAVRLFSHCMTYNCRNKSNNGIDHYNFKTTIFTLILYYHWS
jgi:hypothetical protein